MHELWRERMAVYHSQSLYRQRSVFPPQGDDRSIFCSNDYLGLARHPEIIHALQHGAAQYGVGGTASQIVTGHRTIHQAVEKEFARFLKRDAALLFSCGYMANIGVISAIARKGDVLLMDKYVHASLLDAAHLSRAKWYRFPHKDYDRLETLLSTTCAENSKAHAFIVTDSVFSMHGDMADLQRCAQLAQQYSATLVVDDAHGIGVLGACGGGVSEYFNLGQDQLPILICPLAKAFGVMGAIVAGSHDLIDYLVQFARSYMYTTAIPPALATAALKSVEVVARDNWRREKVIERIRYFKKQAKEWSVPLIESNTPIQYMVMRNAEHAVKVSNELLKRGVIVHAMRPPSVPANQSGLRVTLSCLQEEKEIDELLSNVRDLW